MLSSGRFCVSPNLGVLTPVTTLSAAPLSVIPSAVSFTTTAAAVAFNAEYFAGASKGDNFIISTLNQPKGLIPLSIARGRETLFGNTPPAFMLSVRGGQGTGAFANDVVSIRPNPSTIRTEAVGEHSPAVSRARAPFRTDAQYIVTSRLNSLYGKWFKASRVGAFIRELGEKMRTADTLDKAAQWADTGPAIKEFIGRMVNQQWWNDKTAERLTRLLESEVLNVPTVDMAARERYEVRRELKLFDDGRKFMRGLDFGSLVGDIANRAKYAPTLDEAKKWVSAAGLIDEYLRGKEGVWDEDEITKFRGILSWKILSLPEGELAAYDARTRVVVADPPGFVTDLHLRKIVKSSSPRPATAVGADNTSTFERDYVNGEIAHIDSFRFFRESRQSRELTELICRLNRWICVASNVESGKRWIAAAAQIEKYLSDKAQTWDAAVADGLRKLLNEQVLNLPETEIAAYEYAPGSSR